MLLPCEDTSCGILFFLSPYYIRRKRWDVRESDSEFTCNQVIEEGVEFRSNIRFPNHPEHLMRLIRRTHVSRIEWNKKQSDQNEIHALDAGRLG
jgi:hypothetical protein